MTDSGYVSADEILPAEMFALLTPEARRVYEKIWNLMRKKNKDNVWISDNALSVVARVPYRNVAQAKIELERAKLFKIRCGQWPANEPENICHEYHFL